MGTVKTSVFLILDLRSKKVNDKYPVKYRIIINRKSVHISTGITIEEKFWIADKEQISPKCRTAGNITRLNNSLLREKARLQDRLMELSDSGQLSKLSMVAIKDRILDKNPEAMTLDMFNSVIQDLETAKRYGNARVYLTALRSISTFLKDKDLPLIAITFEWLKKYEAWYLSKGNSVNGLSVNMRTLRSLYNMAIKNKLISLNDYPFRDYVIRKEETRKRAINRDELIRFLQFEPKTERHKRAKDYFLISFYLMGASFVDIAMLKLKDMLKDKIEYKRQKTGKLHSIPVSEPLRNILKKYIINKKDNDFILNIVRSTEAKKQLVEIRDELRRYNRSLKEISVECGIESKISSYVARHSYATSAKRIGVPTAVISEALGHSTEKTTQIYLDSFDNTTINHFHDEIINSLKSK